MSCRILRAGLPALALLGGCAVAPPAQEPASETLPVIAIAATPVESVAIVATPQHAASSTGPESPQRLPSPPGETPPQRSSPPSTLPLRFRETYAAPASAGAAAAPLAAQPSPSLGSDVTVTQTWSSRAIDPLRPGVRIDPDDAKAHANLWTRIRRGFVLPNLDSDLVRQWETRYASQPDYVARMTERASRYLFHIVEEIERRRMPTELALLPFIESAFNPHALSVARASGMWQFIPSTGRDYELRQNLFRDDRRDVLASTRAALDYLGRLHSMFGDWRLALAAYNWGEGNVQRAIARNERAGLQTDYESLRMPDETRNYVPKLQAVKNIVLDPAAFSLTLPRLDNHPYFLVVPIDRDIDVDVAARLAGVPLDEFKALNPQLNQPVILAAGTPQVLLPYDNAKHFIRELPRHGAPLASWTAWIVPRTMRPGEAARLVGMSEYELRQVNRIPLRVLVTRGSTLIVPRNGDRPHDVSEDIADNATIAFAPEIIRGRRVTLKAARGDSVASVARRYRIAPSLIADWNGVKPEALFSAGQTIVVYLKPIVTRSARTVQGRPARSVQAARPRR